MALRIALIYLAILSWNCVSGDFFSDLDKLDIDAKLREIDKAISGMDKGDDPVINKPNAKGKKPIAKPKTDEDEPGDFGSAVEMLAGMFGGGECKFQCKNGNKPVAKTGHVPTSNGCGSSGIKIDTDDIPGMEECCHVHDHCYDTCNSDRDTCDKDFKTCLHDICNKVKSSTTKSKTKKVSYKDCKSTADLMYGGTVALGCDPFMKAQENACSCSVSNSDKNPKKKVDPKPTSSSGNIRKDKNDRTKSGRRNDEL